MGTSYLADPRKCIGMSFLEYGGIEGTIWNFSQYILMDIPIGVIHFRKTKERRRDLLFDRFYLGIIRHVLRHIHVLLLVCYRQFKWSEQI